MKGKGRGTCLIRTKRKAFRSTGRGFAIYNDKKDLNPSRPKTKVNSGAEKKKRIDHDRGVHRNNVTLELGGIFTK